MQGLALAQESIALLGRCLDVTEHLAAWRATGSVLKGTLASDVLDQALGLADELAAGEASSLAAIIRVLLEELPPSVD